MESSDVDFDLTSLLIGENDPYDDEVARISIEGGWIEDEDGDPAVNLKIVSTGASARGILYLLAAAYEAVAEQYAEELEDDD